MTLKVLSIFGTRPEAIKMAPIVQQLAAHAPRITSYVCVTAQHREMLDQVLNLFHITPDFDLDLMQQDQTPTQVAARILLALDPLLKKIQPDWIIVQGDTTTVMAAAIAAHYNHVRVAHVEAGLRTFDRQNPFPEEMNRVVADHVSDAHFAPTWKARDHLLREGIQPACIHVTGNSVTDALLQIAQQPLSADVKEWFRQIGLDNKPDIHKNTSSSTDSGERARQHLLLVTAHRRENHGQPIRQICYALRQLAETRPDVQIVYPVHRSPHIWQPVHELLDGVPGIALVPPIDYFTLVQLMKRSKMVLTDSGGIQEEAPSLGIPVLVLRTTTERPEAAEAGVARLVGTNPQRIQLEVTRLLDEPTAYKAMSHAINPYGDGNAAKRIVDVLLYGHCQEFVSTSLPMQLSGAPTSS
jgi:UDP-N-acetylglucosamine 2-epimerase (non-hydrolysing)